MLVQTKRQETISRSKIRNMLISIIFLQQITALKIKFNPFAKAFLDAKER